MIPIENLLWHALHLSYYYDVINLLNHWTPSLDLNLWLGILEDSISAEKQNSQNAFPT